MGLVNLVAWVRGVAGYRRQTRLNPQRRVQLRVEALEAREVPTINPTGLEQEMLELVNRMRMSPQSELSRLLTSTNPIQAVDPQVQAALSYFGVSGSLLASQWAGLTAVQPLAWSDGLLNASRLHSQLMIAKDTQSHQLPGEASLGSRITTAGYTGWSTAGENVYAFSNTVGYGHAGFAIDWGYGPGGIQSPAGHRVNLMNGSYREIGISVIAENSSATQVGPLVITQDFGVRYNQGNSFLLGVVFADGNSNKNYNAGEGLAGVSITIVGNGGTYSTTTLSAGGYQLQVPAGSYTVTFSGGGLGSAITKSVTVGSANVKLDTIAGQTGNPPPTSSNHAPVLDASFVATLSKVNKGTTNPAGNTVASIVGTSITDVDAGAVEGIAVYAADTANGQWQYSLNNGTTWNSFGALSTSAARLLRSSDLVRLVPNSTFMGSASITYRAWDQTSGTAGNTANLSSTGGSSAYSTTVDSASVTVSSSNSAPVLNTGGTYQLPFVAANSTTPPSVLVSTLLGSNVSDSDVGALKGLAITAIDSTLGTWQYNTTGGTSWKNLTTVSNSSALLLRSTDSLRFYPKAGSTGITSFVFRAWDQTSGSAGAFANLSAVGGSTAFSADQVFAREQVGNSAPVLSTASPFKLNTGNAGTLVSALLGQSVSDADLNALRGIAVTSLTGTTSGVWQYSLDAGKTWKNMGALSTSAVLLLRSQDLVRFVPNAGFKGTVSLQFRAWDQTTGVAGVLVNLTPSRWGSLVGGATAYSSALGTANLQVT